MRKGFGIIIIVLSAVLLCMASCNVEPVDATIDDKTENSEQEMGQVKVLEYRPAMGQFVNVLPEYEEGDTEEAMCKKAEEMINRGAVVTLGGFGGSITMSLGEPIKNMPNSKDFRILGNAFISDDETMIGNSEPGVVWVSVDRNGNGIADDEWYELAGSEYYKPETQHNYKKTWHKSDTTLNNRFHTQPYFPMWVGDTVIEVSGTLLASHMVKTGDVIAQQILEYGYADNRPNTDTFGTAFDLDWAVDENGQHVQIDECDFVRVVTAVDEVYPMIGELSTEVGMLIVF